MEQGFWGKLKKPIMILAPMADVTDAAFRQIIAKYSRPQGPDVFYTEFVSADGLCHPVAREKLKRELFFTEAERPIVAQIFSGQPAKIKEAAKLIVKMGFDGLDINMGCPDKSVEKQGAGADLIKDPKRAQAIILAAKAGVAETSRSIPVTVKTRIGYYKISELAKWTEALLEVEPVAITFHLRTRQEMSKVPAHYDLLHIPVEMARGTDVMIFGNGDVADVLEAKQITNESGADGMMLGRAIFGNPWLFANLAQPRAEEKLKVLIEHVELFEKLFRGTESSNKSVLGHPKSFAAMKKHFKAYVNGFPGAIELRAELMQTETAGEVKIIIERFLKNLSR